jgi:hypothetical protein
LNDSNEQESKRLERGERQSHRESLSERRERQSVKDEPFGQKPNVIKCLVSIK